VSWDAWWPSPLFGSAQGRLSRKGREKWGTRVVAQFVAHFSKWSISDVGISTKALLSVPSR